MADRDRLQSGDEGVADGVEVGVGHDHSADGGAFLAGLGDHFADDGVAERSELRRVGPGRWRRTAALSESASAEKRTLVRARQDRASDWAVAAEPVKARLSCSSSTPKIGVMSPATNCNEPSGSRPEARMVALRPRRYRPWAWPAWRSSGRRRGTRRELFEHPPHGEVEGVDLDGDSGAGDVDVPGDEAAVAAQRLNITVGQTVLLGSSRRPMPE